MKLTKEVEIDIDAEDFKNLANMERGDALDCAIVLLEEMTDEDKVLMAKHLAESVLLSERLPLIERMAEDMDALDLRRVINYLATHMNKIHGVSIVIVSGTGMEVTEYDNQ